MATMELTPVWSLRPGDRIERKALQETYGGRTQGGIGPSKASPNVLIFSDPIAGEQHGYVDGWMPDGCFHYTGEGQRGDQQMKSGNASILRHQVEGRALRVFQGARGTVTYLGEFEVDADRPYYITDAPETGGGPLRAVIVFRLRPKDIAPAPASMKLAGLGPAPCEEVPVEEQWTEKAFVDPAREPYEMERREAKLVLALRDYLRSQGHSVVRLKLLPEGEAKPILTDLYDKTANLLVEAKGTTERGAVRMALGQLADYRRFLDAPKCAILLPAEPRLDLKRLAAAEAVTLIWPTGTGFHFERAPTTAQASGVEMVVA
ncbi:restriction endonuclease [Azospirillum formosense]|uniref:Restriction endonuclease n=1 Tax=Azospirillum formosense TaxID=861533 RepID=A0ABX2KYW4_9PROT|nr:restriction endonuclease [Azospirillum formosense]MBY3757731.1 restriction endonuclease [Azospirillum formosense]NUB18733.1 restriction endonuclease [Azospirillum formosense]